MAKQMHVNLLNMMNWNYSISNFWKGMVQQAVFVLQEVTVAVEIQECEFKGFFFFPVFVWFLWFSDYFKAVTRAQTNHTFYTMPWALDFPSSTTATERPLVFKCIPAVFFFLVKKLNAHKVSSAQLCRYNEHMLPAGNACTDLFYQTCLPKLGSEEFTSEEKRTGRLCVYPANRKRLIYGGATS